MLETFFAVLLWLQGEPVENEETASQQNTQPALYSNGGGCPGGICGSDKEPENPTETPNSGND